jgi:hypothetical protein
VKLTAEMIEMLQRWAKRRREITLGGRSRTGGIPWPGDRGAAARRTAGKVSRMR